MPETRRQVTQPSKVVYRRLQSRDPAQRDLYARAALSSIPRLLGAIDRNPYRRTYGCLDREFWHYRTSAFPSEMFQEGVLPLALVYTQPLPGNRWLGDARVRELAVAALRFSAGSCHADGSCDDYYPYERALGAAVFSLAAAASAYALLGLNDAGLLRWFHLRAGWLLRNDESGRLSNHHALAALGLHRVGEITGEERYLAAAKQRVRQVLEWQSAEGWFEEYGGADPGYQTVTIDCLAKYRRLTGAAWLDESLERGVAFARLFLHPDGSYAGEYGSRGTYHFYPHGMELLAARDPHAAELADGFLGALAAGKHAHFDDDRLYAHRLGNLIEAWRDWAPRRAAAAGQPKLNDSPREAEPRFLAALPAAVASEPPRRYLKHARLFVQRDEQTHTIVSAARGGVFKRFEAGQPVVTDAGLIVELDDGQVAVSQAHDLTRDVRFAEQADGAAELTVGGRLAFARFETATPLKQSVFYIGLALIGRWRRTLVRKLLQRRLITGQRPAPVRLCRKLSFFRDEQGRTRLRVEDTIELTRRGVRARRMSFGTDHQAAYVAASDVYQDSVLRPWTDLDEYVAELNEQRVVTVRREF